MANHPTVNIAMRAARNAGNIIMHASDRLDLIEVQEKGLNDYVSEIDKQAEAEIIYHINKAFPDHGITAEESGVREGNQDSEFQWIIDPLDGTTNFVRGIPHFAISIACKYQGKLEHGVIFDPVRQEEFSASRGKGAQLNGKRIRVSKQPDLDRALLGTGIPFKAHQQERCSDYMRTLEDLAPKCAGIRRMGAASLDLAYVAAGRLDAFWEIGLQEWDMAAGALLVREAGGLVADLRGGQDFLESGSIVCGGPKCFKAVLQTVGPILA